MRSSKDTSTKDTGAKNNNSDNDVDYKNSSKAAPAGSASVSNKVSKKESR